MNFNHIGIKILDIEKSKSFYINTLNCKMICEKKNNETILIFLDSNGLTIELIYKLDNSVRNYGPIDHLAFEVNNLDEEILRFKTDGYEFSPKYTVGNHVIAFCDGPNNERIELMELLK